MKPPFLSNPDDVKNIMHSIQAGSILEVSLRHAFGSVHFKIKLQGTGSLLEQLPQFKIHKYVSPQKNTDKYPRSGAPPLF